MYVIGSKGSTDGRFLYPRGVCQLDNVLYVADTDNDRIVVIDSGGRCVRDMGGFTKPYAVAASQERLFVAELSGRLHALTVSGVPLQSLDAPGGEEGIFCGLCADARRVYAAAYAETRRAPRPHHTWQALLSPSAHYTHHTRAHKAT